MKIQYIKQFSGPSHELRGVRIPCYHEGPDDVAPVLKGEHWAAVSVQFLGEHSSLAIQTVKGALP